MVIKILKDTPFDTAGSQIGIQEFRRKYNYLCTGNISDDELIAYLEQERYYVLKTEILTGVGEWFEVIRTRIPEDIPLAFIYEGVIYRKELDGMYHNYLSGNSFMPADSLGSVSIQTAKELLDQTKFKRWIPYLTNNVNKKL